MKKIMVGLSAALVFLSAISLLSAQSSPQDQQKAMEAYMKAMAVTENHSRLKFFVGSWDVSSTMWSFPGTPPTTSQNSGQVTSIMGGRFIMMKFSGTIMGQPFEGIQIVGYDNMQKKYVTFWIDSSSTAFFLLSGTYDAAKNTWMDTGQWADPMGGTTPVRGVTQILGPDEYIYEMYMGMPDGKEFKSLENRCLRRK
jgi:hypothetical protein